MFGIDDGSDPGPPKPITWRIFAAWLAFLALAVALIALSGERW